MAWTHIAGVVGAMLVRLWAGLVAGLGVAPGALAEARLDGHYVALRGEDVAACRVVQGVVLIKELRGHRAKTSLIHMPRLIHPHVHPLIFTTHYFNYIFNYYCNMRTQPQKCYSLNEIFCTSD